MHLIMLLLVLQDISFEERVLATVPEGYELWTLELPFSSTGSTAGFIAIRNEKQFVFLGNQRSSELDEASMMKFSPDGRRLAYKANRGGKQFIVAGGKESQPFDEVTWPDWNRDGTVAAYGAKKDGKAFIMVGDKKATEDFDEVRWPVFGEGSTLLGFAARIGKKWFVVAAGKKGEEFDSVYALTASPDLKTLAYCGVSGGRSCVVLGIRRGPWVTRTGPPVFHPKDGTVAYAVTHGGQMALIVGDKVGGEVYDDMGWPIFNADGTSIAYHGTKGDQSWAVVGGAKLGPFDGVNDIVFAPDGKSVAFKIYIGKFDIKNLGSQKHALIVNGRRGKEYDFIRHTAVFSPDGKKVAYLAGHVRHIRMVVGDVESSEFDEMSLPVFSSDGTKVGFVALKGREFRWNVMTVK